MDRIIRYSTGLGKVLSWVAVAALLIMIGVTLADVFLRLVFTSPITGAVEIVRMMMVCMSPAFVAALFANRHVSVGLVVDNLSRKAQLAFDVFGYGLSAIICGVICYQGFVDMARKMAQNQVYTMLKIPTWPFFLIFAIAMGLLAIAIIIKLIDNFNDKDKYAGKGKAVSH